MKIQHFCPSQPIIAHRGACFIPVNKYYQFLIHFEQHWKTAINEIKLLSFSGLYSERTLNFW